MSLSPVCPSCSKDLSGATAVDGSDVAPRGGDITVCIYCSAALRFAADLSVLPLSKRELMALPYNERAEIVKARSFISWYNERKKRN